MLHPVPMIQQRNLLNEHNSYDNVKMTSTERSMRSKRTRQERLLPSPSFGASSSLITTLSLLAALTLLVLPLESAMAFPTMRPLSQRIQHFTLAEDIMVSKSMRRVLAGTALSAMKTGKDSNSDKKKSANNPPPPEEPCTEIEFDVVVGKALDTLRKDYADLLVKDPDYSIYAKDIDLVDPSGVTVQGKRNYQNAFSLLHTLVKFVYCPNKSAMTSVRMCYDPVKRSIRIHWNAQVIPREIFGGSHKICYVDGISVYEFDRCSGDIHTHRFERLVMNNKALQPKEGVVAALSRYHGVTVPSFYQRGSDTGKSNLHPFTQDSSDQVYTMNNDRHDNDNHNMYLAPFLMWNNQGPQQSLFASADRPSGGSGDASSNSQLQSMEASSNGKEDMDNMNWEAFENKNKARKKFGLAPLTPEEFLRVESTVQEMDAAQQLKRQQQQQAAAAAAAQAEQERQRKANNPFNKLFGNVLKDTCEDNFDCQRPEVCCDFGFKKMCCASGSPVLGQQWATVPVPVGIEDNPQNQPPPKY